MPDQGASQFFRLLKKTKPKNIAIICHRHADPDAYLSAFALSRLFGKTSAASRVDIVTPEGMSALTERLRAEFEHATVQESDLEYDLFVAVDIGHTELLKNWLGKITLSRCPKVLIDHHPIQKDSIYDNLLVDPSASSTSEIVARVFEESGKKPDRETAQALLVGILFDSQHLAIAGEGTLRTALALIERGAELESARRLLRSPPDYGEVIAKLKGVKRSRIFRINSWVVGTSKVGSFQSHVARALVILGADVAIAAGDFNGETRASMRANQRFYEATKIHLGIQLAEVISKDSGYGGGHATAASFTCKLSEDKAVEGFLSLLATMLNAKPVEVT